MNLAELADRVSTLDIVIAVVFGLLAWGAVNAIGLVAISRYFKKSTNDRDSNWRYSSLSAGVRLLATLSGIAIGVLTVLISAY